jgi:hypothetical protein
MSRRVSIFGSSFASNVYLFDDPAIAAGIAAPFALFRLKSAYVGPVVDVRRTVEATTTIVSVGLGSGSQFTLDAPVTGVVTGSSTAVNLGQFVNASGYANPDGLPAAQDWFYSKGYNQNNGAQVWEQPTAVSQPRGGTAGVMALRNSRAEMVFDGSNDFCDFGVVGGVNKPLSHSVLSVGTLNGPLNTNQTIVCTGNSSGATASTWATMFNRGTFAGRLETAYGNSVSTFYTQRTTNVVITLLQQNLFEIYKESGVQGYNSYVGGVAQPMTFISGSAVNSEGTNVKMSVGKLGEFNGFYLSGGVQFIGVWTASKESDRLAMKAKINAMLGTTW